MTFRIEPYEPRHLDQIIDLSLRAWAPVFVSMEQALDPEVYRAFYPGGWEASQRAAVSGVCGAEDIRVWVAVEDGPPLGFVAVKLHAGDLMGEATMVAVDPAAHRRGVASALMRFAEERMREAGMAIAMVETGGDPGHAPARAAYESLGFRQFPVARYFKKL
ncbi:MAG TPA: GNAT family N-acetyltransferase [Herpetosiphonaceae bacterium]